MAKELVEKFQNNLNEKLVGKEETTKLALACLLAGGHLLLEDAPGVGKTTLGKTMADSMSVKFGRVQFTPDTLPSDIVGMSLYDMKSGEFVHRDGVVMNNIVLGDEINRTSPKTQASLLEAMAEGRVTVDGESFNLPEPFMVIATQNPVEFLGTYPLPEAQLDRFMMRLSIGYPDEENEKNLMKSFLSGNKEQAVEAVCKAEDIMELQKEVTEVEVSDRLIEYIENIILETRKESRFKLGISPRGMLHLVRLSQSFAYLNNRNYVIPDDVKAVAECCLAHRLVLTSEAMMKGEVVSKILKALILKVKIPV